MLVLAQGVIATPYVAGAASPADGWDCWGLVRWGRREWGGLASPCAAAGTAAIAALAGPAQAWAMSGVVRASLSAWRPCAEGPLAVVSLRNEGVEHAHVGLCLGGGWFFHATREHGTLLSRLARFPWSQLIGGFYDA